MRVVGILVRRSNDRLGSRQKLKLSPLALGCSPCQRSSLHWPRLLPSHKLEENEPCQSPLFIHARALKFFEWLHKLHSLSTKEARAWLTSITTAHCSCTSRHHHHHSPIVIIWQTPTSVTVTPDRVQHQPLQITSTQFTHSSKSYVPSGWLPRDAEGARERERLVLWVDEREWQGVHTDNSVVCEPTHIPSHLQPYQTLAYTYVRPTVAPPPFPMATARRAYRRAVENTTGTEPN